MFEPLSGYPYPVDNFGTVVGENPTPYGILALWAVNGLSIVYWVYAYSEHSDCMLDRQISFVKKKRQTQVKSSKKSI